MLDLSSHTLLPGLVGLHEHTYFGGVGNLEVIRLIAEPQLVAFPLPVQGRVFGRPECTIRYAA